MATAPKQIVDPEQLRWYKTYPTFPGVFTCVGLLRRSNVKGTWIDQVCFELREHASETADELISAFRNEQDAWVRLMLLSIMAQAALPVFQPLFIEQGNSEDDDLRKWARWGLEKLDTKEARTALREFENE